MSGTTRVSRYQKGKTRKVKTNLDLQEIVSGSGICWAICNVCTSSQTTNQHSTTQFFTGRMPFLPPNQQRQNTEGKLYKYCVYSYKFPYVHNDWYSDLTLLVPSPYSSACSVLFWFRRRLVAHLWMLLPSEICIFEGSYICPPLVRVSVMVARKGGWTVLQGTPFFPSALHQLADQTSKKSSSQC